ncbi:MAG: type II toxin-antitoxin system RelE/ParE family toxin [Verrucomicrobiota bacterium]
MESYLLEWRRSTKKDLRKIPAKDAEKIVATAELLRENPYPDGCKKLHGSDHAFRIRVGNYRILYEVFDKTLIIEVLKIGDRKDIYRT